MREFVFDIEYEEGADPLADVFLRHPELAARSFEGCLTAERFFRIERYTGPAAALEAVRRCRFDGSVCTESIETSDCGGDHHHDVLEATDGTMVLYTYVEGARPKSTVQTLVRRYLPPGTVCETRRREDRHEWRVLARSDEKVGLLYDTLGARLRSGLRFRYRNLGETTDWRAGVLESTSLPVEQRDALEAAVESGYYETPRRTTLDEIADRLDVPRSTLSYRLRRAEAELVARYVEGSRDW
ncbi:helix-turn-helix domain-containing protein [Natronomonas marina]|jgi:predicted DNA binding protein|uniref:helix-turn-helix domain-containing protein n=1 Tax=Natronomonas marina TaxID=2961939 RepID=UPI0020C9D3D7|nr:helix-turn-helix domain-containing protein [Natronomonas marina]